MEIQDNQEKDFSVRRFRQLPGDGTLTSCATERGNYRIVVEDTTESLIKSNCNPEDYEYTVAGNVHLQGFQDAVRYKGFFRKTPVIVKELAFDVSRYMRDIHQYNDSHLTVLLDELQDNNLTADKDELGDFLEEALSCYAQRVEELKKEVGGVRFSTKY